MRLSQRLTDRIVERRIRIALSPEHVHEVLQDTLDMLSAGLGHVGLPPELLSYFESQLDLNELSASISARLIHLLGAD